MKISIKIWSLSFLFFFQGCILFSPNSSKRYLKDKKRDYVTVAKAEKVSEQNKDFKDGFTAAFDKAHIAGYQAGEKVGIKKGIKKGMGIGADTLLQQIDRVKNNDRRFLALYLDAEKHKETDKMEGIRIASRAAGYEECQDEYYGLGFNDGYASAFDSTYNIWLKKGHISLRNPEPKIELVINYDKVANLLSKIETSNAVDYIYFNQALKEVHIEILTYIMVLVEFTREEEQEILEFYERMHPDLSSLYYRKYVSHCQSKNRNFDKSFYDYRYHTSVNAFLQIVNSGICSVADRVVTFAKNNTQHSAVEGFESMGHICEAIIEKIVVPMEDLFLKNAVRLDYNATLPQINQITTQIITSEVAETRRHCKKIKETFSPGGGASVDIEMEIITIIEVGYDVNSLEVEVDHNQQRFTVNLTQAPRFIRTVYQDYKVLCIKNRVSCNPITNYTKFTITEEKLQSIFETNRDNPRELDIAHKFLKKQTSNKLVPMLTKILEPCVVLPYSCYSAKMKFGRSSSELIAIKCK